MSVYTSRDFSFPVEVAGSGVREFSQFNTYDFILERMYIQTASAYAPLPLGVYDVQYKRAMLVQETETKREMGMVWFKRTYATLPSTRREGRELAYTFPGKSGLKFVNDSFVWDRYAKARPSSVVRNALAELSYSVGEPTTGLPTQIVFDGNIVDFVGSVYSDDGTQFLGNTSPTSAPTVYVVSDTARRWMGQIWEREIVTVRSHGGLTPI